MDNKAIRIAKRRERHRAQIIADIGAAARIRRRLFVVFVVFQTIAMSASFWFFRQEYHTIKAIGSLQFSWLAVMGHASGAVCSVVMFWAFCASTDQMIEIVESLDSQVGEELQDE